MNHLDQQITIMKQRRGHAVQFVNVLNMLLANKNTMQVFFHCKLIIWKAQGVPQ